MRKKSCTFAAESCRSGRTGQTRNLLNPSGFRGFESLTFRSPSIKGSEVVLHSLLIRRTFGDSSLSQEWTDNQNKVLLCRALIDVLQGRSRQRKGYPIPHLHSKERTKKEDLAEQCLFACQGRSRQRKESVIIPNILNKKN